MASLDATHDDMIDLLIGHANHMAAPMTPEQISRHSQVSTSHNPSTTMSPTHSPHFSSHHHHHHPHHQMDHDLHNQSSSSSSSSSPHLVATTHHQMSSHFRPTQHQLTPLFVAPRPRDRNNPLDHPHPSLRHDGGAHHRSHHGGAHNQISRHHHLSSSRNGGGSSHHDLPVPHTSSHDSHHLSSRHPSIPPDRGAHHNTPPNPGSSYHHSQNQVTPELHSHHNKVSPEIHPHNQTPAHLHSQDRVRHSEPSYQSEIIAPPQNETISQNQLESCPRYSSKNQLASSTHLDSQRPQNLSTHGQVTSHQNQVTSQSHVTPPPDQVTSHQNQVTSQPSPPTSQDKRSSNQNEVATSQESQVTPQHQTLPAPEDLVTSHHQTQQTDHQNDAAPDQDKPTSVSQEALPDFQEPEVEQIPGNQSHNQYLCAGCHKSILYTNRTSLVQLLSLHQQKCPGNQEYRYMCLDCHSAFKSVVQLKQHEDTCGSGINEDGDLIDQDVDQDDSQEANPGQVAKLPSNTSESKDIQAIPESTSLFSPPAEDDECDIKPVNGAIDKQDEEPFDTNEIGESKSFVDGEENVTVRESWTQTFQPYIKEEVEEELVEELLDEISPAGRKRRTCARKMKVYNEKQLADQREIADLERIKQMAGKKSAKACKKDLRKFSKIRRFEKKGIKVAREPYVRPPEPEEEVKPEKKKKEKIPKVPKAPKKPKEPKEPELEVALQCQLCPKTFMRYSVYTKHYQLHHEKAMCQYCGLQCIRKKLKQHEKSHEKSYQCPYPGCPRVLNSKHRLKRHSRVHTGEKPFLCDICSKPFAGKENMVKHKKRVHEKERKYQCRFCGQKFADKGGLKYHENTHTKIRPTDYRCKYCGRGYKSHVGCYLHERTHTGNMYKCGYCGKEFMAKVHLRKHEYIHTGNYPYRCGNCQKGFPNNGMMKKHKCLAVL